MKGTWTLAAMLGGLLFYAVIAVLIFVSLP